MAIKRKAISKKTRFDIFKRDDFTCQYCGQKPPAVVLEVDHVMPVSKGGDNEKENLVTSCFDCNRGKGAGVIDGSYINASDRLEEMREREEQLKAYERALKAKRRRIEKSINKVSDIFSDNFKGWSLTDMPRRSIKKFLEYLPESEVEEAMHIACDRKVRDAVFKYFCGVCWRKIKGT